MYKRNLKIIGRLLSRFDKQQHINIVFFSLNTTKGFVCSVLLISYKNISEPHCEKTGFRGFRPGPTQTGLYSHRRWLEA